MDKKTKDTLVKVGTGIGIGLALAGISKLVYDAYNKPDIFRQMKERVLSYRTDPFIRKTANELIKVIPHEDILNRVRAIYCHVQSVFNYLDDPYGLDYVASPRELEIIGGGDCDCLSVYLATLLVSSGHKTQLVFVPGHVFVRVYIPAYQKDDLPYDITYWPDITIQGKWKNLKGVWVPIESTGKNIDIGVLSEDTIAYLKKGQCRVMDLKG
ncbi:MAG: hypothetical protein KKA79_02875 [Nanoarchaeota archaeon]|nr:hypothetical protein [Nanoarchaeota archaeon]